MHVLLADVGNPDRGQDASKSVTGLRPKRVLVNDYAEASKVCRDYIEKHDLGGGNWSGGQITNEIGQPIAEVSYNGAVWPLPRRMGDEPLWPRKSAAEKEAAAKAKAEDPCSLKWESATLDVPGFGPLELTGSFRHATAKTVPGRCAVDGGRVESTIEVSFTREGVTIFPARLTMYADGDLRKPVEFPPATADAVLDALKTWYAEPDNALMILRNEREDKRQSLAVAERNLGYKVAETTKMREEVDHLRNVLDAWDAELASAVAAAPKI